MITLHSIGHWYRLGKKRGNRVHSLCSNKYKTFNKDLPAYGIFKDVTYKGEVSYHFGSLDFTGSESWRERLSDLTYISWFKIPSKYLEKLKSKFQIIEENTDWGSDIFKIKKKK